MSFWLYETFSTDLEKKEMKNTVKVEFKKIKSLN